jgi:2-furoyl-CoA dehydrogenase 2Fe-2S iron sulfur subunit
MPLLKRGQLHRISIVLNGRSVSGHAESRMLLSDFLRQELGATGTHVGCEQGVCGACTIRIDGVAARACLILAVQAEGAQIETVEGLSRDGVRLHPLQEFFRQHHGLQCGFCTPGILMSLADFLDVNSNPDEMAMREMLSGHLCRCTGYTGIVQAALAAAAEMSKAEKSEEQAGV